MGFLILVHWNALRAKNSNNYCEPGNNSIYSRVKYLLDNKPFKVLVQDKKLLLIQFKVRI